MKYRRHLIAAGFAGASALLAYGLTHAPVLSGFIGGVELKTVDYRLNNSGHIRGDSTIAIVMFDSASVQDLPYVEPFPRAVLADLVTAAAEGGATAIGLDVYLHRLYPELDAVNGINGDEKLRDAIARAGNVVLVAPTQGSDTARHFLPPHPYFADVAAALGVADLPTPMDVLRDAVLVVRTEEGLKPGFALALEAVARGVDLDSMMAAADATGQLDLPGLPGRYREVPEHGALAFPIRFAGPPSKPGEMMGEAEGDAPIDPFTFNALAASSVALLQEVSPEFLGTSFRGRTVLLGSAFHDSEKFRTAFYERRREAHGLDQKAGEIFGFMYGVEAHANALDNIRSASYMQHLSNHWIVLLLFAGALLTSGMTFWRGANLGAVAGIVVVGATWIFALEVFEASFVVVPIVAPALAVAGAFMAAAGYVSVVEGAEKRMIRGAFSKYVPPGVVDELVADPSKLRLGGEKRTISILFSDVQGFTSMSEVLSPEVLLSVLNEYLDEMSDIVFEERGTLDKYIGDAVMALYGAPTALPDHALHACRSALRMQRRLHEMNAKWQSEGREWGPLYIRIGVNTGTPVVGNIGGQRRFDYTALGDSVNLAARLEPACKGYGVDIMIANATCEAAGDTIIVRELDLLAVYGKAEPVPVYELVALAGEDIGEKAEVLDLYGKGLAAYRNRDFELAIQYLNAALEVDHDDKPSKLYRDRSEEYMLNPPPADWDFVERRQVK